MSERFVKIISEQKLIDLLGATSPKDIRRVKTAVRKHNLTNILKAVMEKPGEIVEVVPDQLICGRKACKRVIEGKYYKIWNGIHGENPSIYCKSCGRKIVFYNSSLLFDVVDKEIDNASRSKDS